MPPSFKIDVNTREFERAIRRAATTRRELTDFQDYGARELISIMKRLVPVDEGTTRDSISSHIIVASDESVSNEVGPETPYAEYIEFGIASRPNYPIQPFVRPAGMEYEVISGKIMFGVKRWLAGLW